MSDFITLRAGMVIPVVAYVLAIDLEARGVRLTIDGPDIVLHGDVTGAELTLLRRYKPHVRLLLQHLADDRHLRAARPREVAPRPDTRGRTIGHGRGDER